MRDTFLGCTIHIHHKGDASKQEQARADRQLEMQNQLTKEQLGMQRDTLATVKGGVSQFLTPEGQGFDPKTLAAMQSLAMNQIPENFDAIRKQLMVNLAQHGAVGGNQPVGGSFLRNLGSLDTAEASSRASALQDIQVKNALANLQNRFSATNAMLGVGSQYNPAPFIGGASSALNSGVTAANNVDQASTGLWGSLLGAGAGLGSSAITKWCWVAAELYKGWFSPETRAIRNWLSTTLYMWPFCLLYRVVGRRWRALIQRNRTARRWTKQLFDAFLVRANG